MAAEGFVLAGGASRRMGKDKAMLDWFGKPLVEHMTSLLTIIASPVRIVGRGSLPDLHPGIGPLAGILTALSVTASDINFIVAVDTPLLTYEFLKYFERRTISSNRALIACKIQSGFPLCLGIRRSAQLLAENYILSGRRSVRGFIEEAQAELITVDDLDALGISPEIFRNLNTESDYQEILGNGTDPPNHVLY